MSWTRNGPIGEAPSRSRTTRTSTAAVARRWRIGVSSLLAAGLAAAALVMTRPDAGPEPTMIGPDGELFGRSHRLDCQFVDDRGELLLLTMPGDPLCYSESDYVVPCDQPGGRPPSEDPG